MTHEQENNPFAYYWGRCLTVSQFMQHVIQARMKLAAIRNSDAARAQTFKLMNLCEDRYHFLVLFAAAMLEGMVTVMPANQSQGELARLLDANPGMQIVNDGTVAVICQNNKNETGQVVFPYESFQAIPADSLVAELYTSGSTGTPMVNPKRWGELVHGAQRVAERFGLSRNRQHVVVATVPPQHMFGFEMSVVLPLVSDVAVYHGKPFYPEDIDLALQSVPEPKVLVTTPVHLKACMKDARAWPEIEFILSSTAALPDEVARKAGTALHAPIREIYGCSEIGAIATRTTTETDSWQLLGDFQLEFDTDRIFLKSNILKQPLLLSDRLAMQDDGSFQLIGRAADLIKIGGKRGSLAEICMRIKAIDGVEDAVVFLPSMQANKRERLVALVVAPAVTPGEIREQLSRDIDAVFVPRQIYLVAKLPYSTAGKLPHSELLAMLAANQKREHAC